MEEMISEKNEREDGSSSCSNSGIKLAKTSQSKVLMLTLGVYVAKCTLTHIGKFDGSLRAGVHEPVARLWMEFSGCNDFSQLLHVSRLDVHNVEALVLNVQIPQVNSEIVAADESLPIAIDRDAVYMISMCISISTARDSCNNGVMMCHAREFEVCSATEQVVCSWSNAAASTCRCKILR